MRAAQRARLESVQDQRLQLPGAAGREPAEDLAHRRRDDTLEHLADQVADDRAG